MKAGGGSGIVEKKISRRGVEKNKERRHIEYSTIGCKVVAAILIIF
jgi:Uri superfamily endonuclease